jgi:hypothetical protein
MYGFKKPGVSSNVQVCHISGLLKLGQTVTVRREPSCADRAVEGRLEAPMQATVLAPVQETVRWRELR